MRVILFWIIVFLLALRRSQGEEDWNKLFEKESINVRTVLFKGTDGSKACWSKSDFNLLLARRLMQNLIPKKQPKNFKTVLKYIKSSIGVLKSRTPESQLPIMTKAMYDVYGGYLKSIVIPMVNEAFYAGNVDYDVTADLHSLLGEMMISLGTNGEQWSPACDMRKIPTKVEPLRTCFSKRDESCKSLLLRSEESAEKEETPGLLLHSKIPMPFLDDAVYPSAIAIPFRDHSLFSLMRRSSVGILPKFYIASLQCLANSSFDKNDVLSFDNIFRHWIVKYVVPHLQDHHRWYPGFGGVMKIIETMNKKGVVANEKGIYSVQVKFQESNIPNPIPCECPEWMTYVLLLMSMILISTCAFLAYFCCIRIRRHHEKCIDDMDDKSRRIDPCRTKLSQPTSSKSTFSDDISSSLSSDDSSDSHSDYLRRCKEREKQERERSRECPERIILKPCDEKKIPDKVRKERRSPPEDCFLRRKSRRESNKFENECSQPPSKSPCSSKKSNKDHHHKRLHCEDIRKCCKSKCKSKSKPKCKPVPNESEQIKLEELFPPCFGGNETNATKIQCPEDLVCNENVKVVVNKKPEIPIKPNFPLDTENLNRKKQIKGINNLKEIVKNAPKKQHPDSSSDSVL